jgi:hypothetical protein
MSADKIYMATSPSLRELADRARRLALVARSDAMREQLIRLAADMDRQAGALERQRAAEIDREAV